MLDSWGTPFVDWAWQATVVLGVALVLARVLRRHPSRAHCVLLVASVAVIALPVGGAFARLGGFGLFAPAAPIIVPTSPSGRQPAPIPSNRTSPPTLPGVVSLGDARELPASRAWAQGSGAVRSDDTSAEPSAASARHPERRSRSLAIGDALVAAWLVTGVLLGLRLVRSWRRGAALVVRSAPLSAASPALAVRLRSARLQLVDRLRLGVAPDLRVSTDVRCPVLWGWRRPPAVLLPDVLARQVDDDLDWEALLTHEMAHWQRRDHWWTVVGQVMACVLPWHPFVWWTRRQLDQLAELAADDRVRAGGSFEDATRFAETLLALVPEERRTVMAAVHRRSNLADRVRRLVGRKPPGSRVGRAWAGAAIVAGALAVAGLSCARERVPLPPAGQLTSEQAAEQRPTWEAAFAPPFTVMQITGRVMTSGGLPLADAQVIVRHADDAPRRQVRTDHDGRFVVADLADGEWTVSVETDLVTEPRSREVVELPCVPEQATLELLVHEPQHIAGVVVDAQGAPVSGARIVLAREYVLDPMTPVQGHLDGDLKAVESDASGRFRFEGLARGWVTLVVEHEDHALFLSPGVPRLETGRDDVVLELSQGFTLRGRVLHEGEPLAGVAVHVGAINLSHRSLGSWDAVTDADGKFEVRRITRVPSLARYKTQLLSVRVDGKTWESDRYSVQHPDEGEELPFVELEARPFGTTEGRAPKRQVDRRPVRYSGSDAGTGRVTLVLPSDAPPDEFGWRIGAYLKPTNDWELDDALYEDLDDSGRCVFEDLPTGEYDVGVYKRYSPAYLPTRVTVGEGQSVEVVLEPGPARLYGTLTSGGRPVEATLACIGDTENDPSVNSSAKTGADGSFLFEGLPFGRYEVRYELLRFAVDVDERKVPFDIALPDTRVEVLAPAGVELPRGDDILGTSDWLLSVDPVLDVPPAIGLGSEANWPEELPGSGGWVIEHLPPGPWRLSTVRNRDDERWCATIEVDPARRPQVVTLQPVHPGRGTLGGRLLDEHGHPSRLQPSVRAFRRDAFGYDFFHDVGRAEVRADNGVYRITGLPAGTYGLLVRDEYGDGDGTVVGGPGAQWLPDVVVVDGQTLTLDIVLPSTARGVVFAPRRGERETARSIWSLDLARNGDWVPYRPLCRKYSGSMRFRAFEDPVFLVPGEYPLLVDFGGPAPERHLIQVEPGRGTQRIVVQQRER